MDNSIKFVSGVGEVRAKLLAKEIGVRTVRDMLYHFPFRYIDRTKVYNIGELNEANTQSGYIQIRGRVTGKNFFGEGRNQRFVVYISDNTGRAELIWFRGIKWVENKFELGREYIIFGRPSFFRSELSLVHPEVEAVEVAMTKKQQGSVQGIYSTTEKLSSALGTKGMYNIIGKMWEGAKGKILSGAVGTAVLAILVYRAMGIEPTTEIAVAAPIFQQFNPFYVVALTPVSLAIFGALASKGKEPSAPRKIAYGMLVAAAGFAVMAFGSFGLLTPDAQKAAGESATFVSANWLISTYLVLTFAELLLSPMGISFVSKVAPPKLKGMMMGGWFVATAIGNMLVSVGGFLWGNIPLWIVWTVFISLCVISAIFMFAMMKKIEKATK